MYKWSRRGKWLWWISPLSLSSRSDCVHTYRQHSVRSRSRSLHDPPQRAGHHGHTHLPTLALLQAHRGASWSGAHGKNEAEEAGLAVLGHHELSEQLQWQRFSKCLNSTRGISKWFSPHLVFCDCEGRSHNDSVGAPTYRRLFFFFFLVLDVMFVVWSFYLSLLMFDSITAPYVFIVLRYKTLGSELPLLLGLSLRHFGPAWNISTSIGCIAMIFRRLWMLMTLVIPWLVL